MNPFKIQNVSKQNVEACCEFDYKGYTILASTILRSPWVVITQEGEFVGNGISSVEAAIEKVNKLCALNKEQKYCDCCDWLSLTEEEQDKMPGFPLHICMMNEKGCIKALITQK